MNKKSEVKFKMNNIYYLSHGGPGSGRYPLGSGDRPYQKFEGSRRKSGGISGYIKARKAKKAEEQQQKRQAEELKKRMEEALENNRHIADKQRVLSGGTATEVMRYQGELTNQELKNAYDRLDLEVKLRKMSEQETVTAIKQLDKIMKNIDKANDWAKIGLSAYNTIAGVYNATQEGQKKPLNFVRSDGGKKK